MECFKGGDESVAPAGFWGSVLQLLPKLTHQTLPKPGRGSVLLNNKNFRTLICELYYSQVALPLLSASAL